MAFTEESNRALKDQVVRSDFRLVDMEFRVGNAVARQRVSTLVPGQISASEAARGLIDKPEAGPGVLPLLAPGPAPGRLPLPDGVVPEVVGGPVDVVVGAQVYTVRGDSSTATVFRGPNLIADGILVRVTGELVHASPILSTDEGVTFLVSDSDVQSSIGRLGGDHDLINMGLGAPVVGDHGIGLIHEQSSVGGINQSRWDVRFHHPVRAGQRLCVEQDVAVGLHFYAVFEVVQFASMPSVNRILKGTIQDSLRVDPDPLAFRPILMEHESLDNRVAFSSAEFTKLFLDAFEPVGEILKEGLSVV